LGNTGIQNEEGTVDSEFEQWWGMWPRKERKESARKKWRKLKAKDRASIREGTPAFVESKRNPKLANPFEHIYGPANFLEDRIWENPDEWKPKTTAPVVSLGNSNFMPPDIAELSDSDRSYLVWRFYIGHNHSKGYHWEDLPNCKERAMAELKAGRVAL
jgi:hypothetical protein